MNNLIVLMFSISAFACMGQGNMCEKKDIVCKSKQFVTVLYQKDFLKAKEKVRLNGDGGLIGMNKEMYEKGFRNIHEILKRHGLPSNKSYSITKLPYPLKEGVEVLLIDSSMSDKDYLFLKLILYFNDFNDEGEAVVVGFDLNAQPAGNIDEETIKKLMEAK